MDELHSRITAYCFKCKKQVPVTNADTSFTKARGVYMTTGNCAQCGKSVSRLWSDLRERVNYY